MTQALKLRVIVEDNDFRRLELLSGMSDTLTELHNTIQFMDPDFNNEFMNVMSVEDMQDRSRIKLVYIQNDVGMSPSASLQNAPSTSSDWSTRAPGSSTTSPSMSSSSSSCSDNTIILTHSDTEMRERAWPQEFLLPRFPYNVEVQLTQGLNAYYYCAHLLGPFMFTRKQSVAGPEL